MLGYEARVKRRLAKRSKIFKASITATQTKTLPMGAFLFGGERGIRTLDTLFERMLP
jgi:hypothetical protein